jgi:hypothetical protein
MEPRVEITAQQLRSALAEEELLVRQLVEQVKMAVRTPGLPQADVRNLNEAIAQATLALRHVEDARMRIGKVLQYAVQGGVPYGGRDAG